MLTLEELSHIEEIKSLKARYWRTMDTRDWEGFRNTFADDAQMFFPELGGALSTEQMLDWIVPFLEDAISVHHGTAPEIMIVDDHNATGIWQIEDELIWPIPQPVANNISRLHGHGHYHDTYVLTERGWRIHTIRLTRLHVITEYGTSSNVGMIASKTS